MARVYADATAYETYHGLAAGDAPANVDTLLRVASRVVDEVLRGVVYAVDAAKLPTDPDVAQALSDAVCAIAGEAEATGALAAGSSQQWESVSIGNVSLQTLQNASVTDTVRVLGVPVPPAARLALAGVGELVVVTR